MATAAEAASSCAPQLCILIPISILVPMPGSWLQGWLLPNTIQIKKNHFWPNYFAPLAEQPSPGELRSFAPLLPPTAPGNQSHLPHSQLSTTSRRFQAWGGSKAKLWHIILPGEAVGNRSARLPTPQQHLPTQTWSDCSWILHSLPVCRGSCPAPSRLQEHGTSLSSPKFQSYSRLLLRAKPSR